MSQGSQLLLKSPAPPVGFGIFLGSLASELFSGGGDSGPIEVNRPKLTSVSCGLRSYLAQTFNSFLKKSFSFRLCSDDCWKILGILANQCRPRRGWFLCKRMPWQCSSSSGQCLLSLSPILLQLLWLWVGISENAGADKVMQKMSLFAEKADILEMVRPSLWDRLMGLSSLWRTQPQLWINAWLESQRSQWGTFWQLK